LDRNRRRIRTGLVIVLFLYPCFGLLDWFVAPPGELIFLWETRLVVFLGTFLIFPLLGRPYYEQHPDRVSSAFMLLVGGGISAMTVAMGGLASPYYAGLSLVIVGSGLLFVWPPRVVIASHSALIASFIVPNVVLGRI